MIYARLHFQNVQGYIQLFHPEFPSNLHNYGITLTGEEPDVEIVQSDMFKDAKAMTDKPIILMSKSDSATVWGRKQLQDERCIGIIKKSNLTGNLQNDEHCYDRYHLKLVYHTIQNSITSEDPKRPKVLLTSDELKTIKTDSSVLMSKVFGQYKDLKVPFDKPIDCHFSGTTVYDIPLVSEHRRMCVEEMKKLKGKNIINIARVDKRPDYIKQLLNSKIVVSPWGYGEMCYRDFEAMFCGCILVKPDTSFVESYPAIYQNDFTYVPCKPDFSDLREQIGYILDDWENYLPMIQRNYLMVNRHQSVDDYASRFSRVVKKLYDENSKCD
jgi:hypothetical protein